MEDVEEIKKKGKGKESHYGKRYGLEFKLRCVKLRLGRDPNFFIIQVGGSQQRRHSPLGEGV